jgi:hypothetical protein
MSLNSEALAKKCEARAKEWATSFRRDTLITVGDVVQILSQLAEDVRASHFSPDDPPK